MADMEAAGTMNIPSFSQEADALAEESGKGEGG
jgi:hypothetical protein